MVLALDALPSCLAAIRCDCCDSGKRRPRHTAVQRARTLQLASGLLKVFGGRLSVSLTASDCCSASYISK